MKINRYLAPNLALFIPLSVSGAAFASILLVLGSALNLYRTKFIKALKHPVSVAVFIYVGVYLFASLYSVGSGLDINLGLRKISRLLYIPLLMPVFMDEKVRQNTIITFISAVSVATIVSTFYRRDPIFLSLFTSFCIFMLAHYAVNYKKYRLLSISVAFLLTYYLFFINIGRVGQLLFFVLFALFMWQVYGKNYKVWIVALMSLCVACSALIYMPNAFLSRYQRALNEVVTYLNTSEDQLFDHTSSTGLRMLLWRNSLQIAEHKPLFGWGTGGYTRAYTTVNPPENIDKIEKRSNPHSQYLLILVEQGVCGLLALFYLFFCLTREFFRSSQIEARLGVGLILCMLIGFIANSWLLDFASMHFFVLFASLFLGGLLNKT